MEEFPSVLLQSGESSDDFVFAGGGVQTTRGAGTPADPAQFVLRIAALAHSDTDAPPTVTLTVSEGTSVALAPSEMTQALFRAPGTAEANLMMTAEADGIYRIDVRFFLEARPDDFTNGRIRFTNNAPGERQFHGVVAAVAASAATAKAPRLKALPPVIQALQAREGFEFSPQSQKEGMAIDLFGKRLDSGTTRIFFVRPDARIEAKVFASQAKDVRIIVPALQASAPYKITVVTDGGSATTTGEFRFLP